MKDQTAAVIVIAFVVLILLLVLASQPDPAHIDVLSGVGIDIYPTSINWGILSPGDTSNSIVQVTNAGNRTITLGFNCSGFEPPEAENYLSLTWDYANQTVEVSQQIDVIFTLAVAINITRIYEFRLNVTVYAVPILGLS